MNDDAIRNEWMRNAHIVGAFSAAATIRMGKKVMEKASHHEMIHLEVTESTKKVF